LSVRRDGSFVRSQRLLDISRLIAKAFSIDKRCNIEDLKLNIAMNIGLTEKTALQYVDLVCRAKGWTIKDGFIYPGV
jgi:hypothetical protein